MYVLISVVVGCVQDSLVLDTPRLRRQVRRYGNDSIEEIVEMNEVIDEVGHFISTLALQMCCINDSLTPLMEPTCVSSGY